SQRLLLSSGRIRGTYAVVKVAHHGSADQEPALYASARAPVALIGVGTDNDYGHPRAETLAFLDALGSRALRTDQRGLILLATRQDELLVWTSKDTAGGG